MTTTIITTLAVVMTVYLLYLLRLQFYFNSEPFTAIKKAYADRILDTNRFGSHIESLKKSYVELYPTKKGGPVEGTTSRYVHSCLKAEAESAMLQPFKYVCKCFKLPVNEQLLLQLMTVLNNFAAVEQGKSLLKGQRTQLLSEVLKQVPPWVTRWNRARLLVELGLAKFDETTDYFPTYVFQYVPGVRQKPITYEVKLDLATLERFVLYVDRAAKFRPSQSSSSMLLTLNVRNAIKARDAYVCQSCYTSTVADPYLMLEVRPLQTLVSDRGSLSSSLKTVCWRCVRAKSGSRKEKAREDTTTSNRN